MSGELVVGEARERRRRKMDVRERRVDGAAAASFLAIALALAVFASDDRETMPLLMVGLVAAYAVVARVRFEFGEIQVAPEPLVFIPMLMLAPLEAVPLLVLASGLLGLIPDFRNGSWHRDRWVTSIGDNWFCVGPVLVLLWLAPGTPTLDVAWAYVAGFGAYLVCEVAWSWARNELKDEPLPTREYLEGIVGSTTVDAVLSPLAFLVGLVAIQQALVLLALVPLVWLLGFFSRDRRERYAAALQLHRAYRGTVMLLADVVESDDPYTAAHSRSVVDLVTAVADEMELEKVDRQELEFVALLHDVGKIAIPKEILHKPAALNRSEFEVMKTHTIEGQFMLDRVGGLLGRVGLVVRSCHERWDGKGYPDGLKGEAIPLVSRIVFACDAFNAMTTDRVYRKAMTVDEALQELRDNSGTQFDRRVVSALVRVVLAGTTESTHVDGVRAILAHNQLAHDIGAPA